MSKSTRWASFNAKRLAIEWKRHKADEMGFSIEKPAPTRAQARATSALKSAISTPASSLARARRSYVTPRRATDHTAQGVLRCTAQTHPDAIQHNTSRWSSRFRRSSCGQSRLPKCGPQKVPSCDGAAQPRASGKQLEEDGLGLQAEEVGQLRGGAIVPRWIARRMSRRIVSHNLSLNWRVEEPRARIRRIPGGPQVTQAPGDLTRALVRCGAPAQGVQRDALGAAALECAAGDQVVPK